MQVIPIYVFTYIYLNNKSIKIIQEDMPKADRTVP